MGRNHYRRYGSRILENVHRTMSEIHEIGGIDDARMAEFDALCLAPTLAPEEIRTLRE